MWDNTGRSLLIAENDPLHRSFLRGTVAELVPECSEFLEAANGAEAISLARDHRPDFVILDLQMPKANGVEAAKAIWRGKPDTRILFWSNYADEAYVRGVAKIVPSQAVYGYVLKSAADDRLHLAIRGVFIEDQCVIDREVRGVQQRTENRLHGITDREYEILVDVTLGLTDRAIAERRNLSVRGAQNRIKHLYEKLDLDQGDWPAGTTGSAFNSRTRAVCVAFQRGLLNPEALRREETRLAEWFSARPTDTDRR